MRNMKFNPRLNNTVAAAVTVAKTLAADLFIYLQNILSGWHI